MAIFHHSVLNVINIAENGMKIGAQSFGVIDVVVAEVAWRKQVERASIRVVEVIRRTGSPQAPTDKKTKQLAK